MNSRYERALQSLEGLSVGDAFGEKFFVNPDVVESLIDSRAVPAAPWRFTDDTMMALSIVSVLRGFVVINQDALANSFARHYDPSRGYGPATHRLLGEIRAGGRWSEVARSQFCGQGSYGNGAAMRVAPLGAFFADDLEMVVRQAELSAVTTHAHSEAVAGAVAVAIAAAQAWRLREQRPLPARPEFLDLIFPCVPDSEVRSGIRKARDLSANATVKTAVHFLGNGAGVSAQDTVPFALWCAGESLGDFEEAMWLTVSGLGNSDTTCAIVGGIVALSAGAGSIPHEWKQAREPLPEWQN